MAPANHPQPDPTAAAPSPGARGAPGLRAKLTENPALTIIGTVIAGVLTILGTAAVGLLFFTLTGLQNNIDNHEGDISALEDKVDTGFAEQGAKISELDRKLTAQISELDRKLTAQTVELDRKLTAQIVELDRKLNAQIVELDRKLTAQIVELDHKLNALISALNATAEVEAAIAGEFLVPSADNAEPSAPDTGLRAA